MPERIHKRFVKEDPAKRSSFGSRNTLQGRMNNDGVHEPSVQAHPHGEKRDRDGNPVTPCDGINTATCERKTGETVQNGEASGNGTRKKPKLADGLETFHNGIKSPKANIGESADSAKVGGKGGPTSRTNKASNGPVEFNESESKASSMRPTRSTLTSRAAAFSKFVSRLPIQTHKADIRWALRNSDVLLLVGETGCGKSTQVPQFLATEPWCKKRVVNIEKNGREIEKSVGGMIAVTEPRRVAAISLAQRVAAEMGSHLARGQLIDSDQVGYSVRFDTLVPYGAKIKFLTEGMLLQELLHDPHLLQYSAVIIDEIHERSVDVDLVAGFLRNIVRGDKFERGGIPLKLVVMSATANMERVKNFFAIQPSVEKAASECFGLASNGVNGHSRQSPVNGVTQKLDTLVNGVRDDVVEDKNGISHHSDNTEVRRASDASFSTWDGIVDDDEPKKPSSLADSNGLTNGIHNHGSVEAASSNPKGHVSVSPGKEGEQGLIIYQIQGRQYPVKILYTPEPIFDYVEATLRTIFKIHTQESLPGDILAFLTGQEEIETLQNLVEHYAGYLDKSLPRIKALPLYGHLSIEQQQVTFAPTKEKRTRKVVLATNIAETSITVPGVKFVIDCGKAKTKRHRPHLGLQSLLVQTISKSSAVQRKGRAGREGPGKCFRLYTEAEYLGMPETDPPEILRTDVVEAVLKMKARGVQNPMLFPLMDPPGIEAIEKALITLYSIGTLKDDGELNEIGQKVARFPLPVHYGRVLVEAAEVGMDCLLEAIDVISCFTAGDDIFLQPKSEEQREDVDDLRRCLIRREGDILTYLTTMQRYTAEQTNRVEWCQKRLISSREMKQAVDIRRQLRNLCVALKMLAQKPPSDPQPLEPISVERGEALIKCFMKAFAAKTASLHPGGSYLTTQGKHVVTIHPSSTLYGRKVEAIMFVENVYTQKNYAKKVSVVQMNWIAEILNVAP